MKRDEPFQPELKSTPAPEGLVFRAAVDSDREMINTLMAERNPAQTPAEIDKRTERELKTLKRDPTYRLHVADLNGRVVGLSRYYHTSGLPTEKKKFPAPEGWYAMGLLVDVKFRRQGIARFLFTHRLSALTEDGASQLYSIVDESNLTSMRMHEEFGFERVAQAAGFLHIALESGRGVLFKKQL